MSPLTKPEMMTNRRTSTLTEVKTLLTDADSFTPKDKSPVREKGRAEENWCKEGCNVNTLLL